MRVATVASIKNGWKPRCLVPTEGTKIRGVYDQFMAHRGEPIAFTIDPRYPTAIDQLMNVYGLDIRRLRNGHWLLAGEWFGREYVDYVAARFHALDQSSQPALPKASSIPAAPASPR